jgi:hypothetical protein
MEIIPTRLSDLTTARHDDHARKGAFLLAVLKDELGSLLTHEPEMLADCLTRRGVGAQVQLLIKAAVSPGVSTDASWAPIAQTVPMRQALLAAIDRQWTLPLIGAIKVPRVNAVGATQTTAAAAYWVGQTAPKPLSMISFTSWSLPPQKCVADVAVSAELLKVATVDALMLIERACVTAVATELDAALLDPANAGIAGVKPAALTFGLTPITPTGDFSNNVAQVLAAISGGMPSRPVLITGLQSALRLTAPQNLGALGVRLVVTPAAGARLIAVDANGVAFVDDGGDVRIGEPSLQMSSSPDSPTTGASVLTSAWQSNLKIIRAERWTNWTARPGAVAYLNVV